MQKTIGSNGRKISKGNNSIKKDLLQWKLHHWVSDFLKVNVTLLILLFVLVLIGVQMQSICDRLPCHTPKTVEDEYTIKGLELNEKVGDKAPTISSAHLSRSMADAIIRTGGGVTKYSQYIRFAGDGRDPIASGTAFFGRDRRGVVNDYLHFNAKDDIYEYSVVFEKGLHSAIQNNKLTDFVNQPLSLLGDRVYIVDATVDTSNKKLTLKMVDTLLVDLLAEGQEKAYRIGSKVYEVKVLIIDNNNQVKFIVNGHETKNLRKGDVVILPDQTVIGVTEMLLNEAGEGADLVKFYVGSTMLEATDKYSDTDLSYDMRSHRASLHSAKVQYVGAVEGTTFTLSSMKFRAEASSKQGDIYIPVGGSLRQQMLEPDAMFPNNWDLVYNGFGIGDQTRRQGTVPLEFATTGGGYNLFFSNSQGVSYTIPFISAQNTFSYGDGKRLLHFTEAGSSTIYPITKNDIFIVTSQNNGRGTTNVLSYDGIDTATKRLFFRDWALGQKIVPYETTGVAGQEGKTMFNAGGHEYSVFISSAVGNSVAVDLNGDGILSGGEANIVLAGGGRLDINAISGSSAILQLIVPARLLRESRTDEATQITITKNDYSVDIDVPNQGDLQLTAVANKDMLLGQTKFGTLFQITRRKTTSGLFIDFPRKQALASVTIKVQNRLTQ